MFIDINSQLSIEIKHIESVEALDDLNCMIYTSSRTYKVTMPKGIILQMIESREKVVKDSSSNIEKLLTQIYSTQSTPRP